MVEKKIMIALVFLGLLTLALTHRPPSNPSNNKRFKEWKSKNGKKYNSAAE